MEHDEGYSFGMGVFETMLVREDRCILLERHLDRLRHGLDAWGSMWISILPSSTVPSPEDPWTGGC